MGRSGWFLVVVAFGTATLLVPGCEPSALPRTKSTPLGPVGLDLQMQAYQIIVDGLADTEPQVRANAIEVVATTGAVRLMPTVQKLLSDPALPVRFAAILAVGDLQYALAKKDVERLLTDPNPNLTMAASYAMVQFGQREYYKTICQEIASTDQTVRANAALLLGKCGRQDGLRFLYWALQRDDSTDKVVLQATESIAILRDHRIYPKLWAQLISAYADDRVLGIQSMGALGTDEAKNALITMLDDSVPEVRLAAAGQLGKLGEPIGEPNVLQILQKSPVTGLDTQGRMFAALAIGEIGTEPLTKYLPQLLQDPSKPVRLAAAKAVLRRAAKTQVPPNPLRPASTQASQPRLSTQ